MASAPTSPLITVDEYLNTSYEHHVEYVDGVLVERSLPTPSHSTLQAILAEHLRKYRFDFHYGVLLECRVELVERSRYRIPDVLLCSLPINAADKVLRTTPLAVIEIWSPEDRMPRQMARFLEYWNRGVRQIIVLDPEEFTAFRYEDCSLIQGEIQHIEINNGQRIPFSSTEILRELRQELARSQ